MLLIKDVLVSDLLFEVFFYCDLKHCKGACCWESDYGAPLQPIEMDTITLNLDKVMDILPESQRKVIEIKGVAEYYNEPEVTGTSLMPDASCVYLIRNGEETGRCAFEILYERGKIDFKKPVSCELYPIRVLKNEELGFTALNYDEWDICRKACELGAKLKIPVFKFLKSGIIREFGHEFYEEMEAYSLHLEKK